MRRSARLILFAFGAAGVAALLVWACTGLPAFGHVHSAYAAAVVTRSGTLRHVSEVVGAVTFDFRGIDTLGEELILLAAIVAVVVLTRVQPDEHSMAPMPAGAEGVRPIAPTECVQLFGLGLVGASTLVGLALVGRGHVTPGGGFQGGVVLASAAFVLYAAVDLRLLEATLPRDPLEPVEAFGGAVYLGVGIAGLVIGGAFLTNVLPFGTAGTIASGGMLPMLNVAVGIEVSTGVLLALHHYLTQALLVRVGGAPVRMQP